MHRIKAKVAEERAAPSRLGGGWRRTSMREEPLGPLEKSCLQQLGHPTLVLFIQFHSHSFLFFLPKHSKRLRTF